MNHLTIDSVTAAASKTADVLVKRFIEMSNSGKVAYLNASIAFIGLREVLGSEAKAAARLKKDGAAESSIKNARRHVAVYDLLVVPAHVTMDYFTEVSFMDAVEINRAVARIVAVESTMPALVAKRFVAEGLFEKPAHVMRDEFALIGDTGLLKKERAVAIAEKAAADQRIADKAAADKAAADKAAADKAAADAAKLAEAQAIIDAKAASDATAAALATSNVAATPVTTTATETAPATPAAPVVATPAPAVVEPVKVAKAPVVANPMGEFEDTAEKLEKLASAVILKADEVTREKIRARVAALLDVVNAAIEMRSATTVAKAVGQ